MVSNKIKVSVSTDTLIYTLKNSGLAMPNNASRRAGRADRHRRFRIGVIGFLPAGACRCQT